MVVERSEKVYGPYVDRGGVPMNLGDGSTVLEGDKAWNGVGQNAVGGFNGVDYLVFHAYDASDKEDRSYVSKKYPGSMTGR